MKKILIGVLMAMVTIGTAVAAPRGTVYDPLYVVAVSTSSTVTGPTYLQGAVQFGTGSNISTFPVTGTLDVSRGIKTSTINATAEFNAGTSTVLGALYVGNQVTAGQISTITAAGAITGVSLTVVGATALDSTLDVDGNVVAGAANYRSTFTAASGNLALTGSLTSLAGLTGTTGTFSGDVKRGAANYVSTFTATTGAEIMTGAFTSLVSVTAPNIIATAIARIPSLALATIMAKTAVMGDIFICNDCSPVEVAISTAAGAPNTGGYGNAVGLQLD